MAKGKAQFAALPLRAIGDTELSGLELRVLACIASFDRMSTLRENGAGAWASNNTMSERVGCDYSRFSSAVTRLAKLGYIIREQHAFDRRKTVYRVVYETDPPSAIDDNHEVETSDISLRTRKLSHGENAPDSLPNGKPNPSNSLPTRKPNGENSLPAPKNSDAKSTRSASEYIPLNGEIDFAEARKDIRLSRPRTRTRAMHDEEPEPDRQASIAQQRRNELRDFEKRFRSEPDSFSMETIEAHLMWFAQFSAHVPNHPDIADHAWRLISEMKSFIETRGAN